MHDLNSAKKFTQPEQACKYSKSNSPETHHVVLEYMMRKKVYPFLAVVFWTNTGDDPVSGARVRDPAQGETATPHHLSVRGRTYLTCLRVKARAGQKSRGVNPRLFLYPPQAHEPGGATFPTEIFLYQAHRGCRYVSSDNRGSLLTLARAPFRGMLLLCRLARCRQGM